MMPFKETNLQVNLRHTCNINLYDHEAIQLQLPANTTQIINMSINTKKGTREQERKKT